MKRIWIWIPLILFLGFFGFSMTGLMNPASSTIQSKMIGKPLPKFSLPPAHAGQPGLGSANFANGQPRLLNVFASWCVPCIAEAKTLKRLADSGIPIDGIAIKDRPETLNRFLTRNGNPYQRIGADNNSSVQMALGSSGVPETFVIDGRGIIRDQYVGDIDDADVADIIAIMRKLK